MPALLTGKGLVKKTLSAQAIRTQYVQPRFKALELVRRLHYALQIGQI